MCLIYGANSRAQCWSAFAATNSPMIFLHKILLFWAAEIRIFGFASVLQDWVDVALKNFTLCWHHLNSWHLSWFKVPRFLAQVELSRTLAASPEGTWMCVCVCLTFNAGCFPFVCDIQTDTKTSGKWDCVFVCLGVGRPDGKVGVKPEAGENRTELIRLNTLPL